MNLSSSVYKIVFYEFFSVQSPWIDCKNFQLIGNGECNSMNIMDPINCNYDGGDCCNQALIGDGICDKRNNFSMCGNYDGGDCVK